MDFWSINWLLIAAIVLTVITVINGFHNGLIKEFINCVSLIVISLVIILLSVLVRSFSDKHVFNTVASIILLLILAIVYKLLNIAFTSAKIFSKLPAVHGINKVFGAAFGVAEAIVVVWAVFCLMQLFEDRKSTRLNSSHL